MNLFQRTALRGEWEGPSGKSDKKQKWISLGNKKERQKYSGIKEKENTWMLTLQSLNALSRVATNY